MVLESVAIAYDPARWESFAVAEVGAAAALAGLVVVAASINLSRIIELPTIVARVAGTLALFAAVLVVGSLVLVPGQSVRLLGAEIAVVGLGLVPTLVRPAAWRGLEDAYRRSTLILVALGGIAAAAFLVAGVSCLARVGGGLYWLAPATVLAFGVGLVNAWVALVEILR